MINFDELSQGKKDAIIWAIENQLEWRYVGGSTIEVHLPGDNYDGYVRHGEKCTWTKNLHHYTPIYDESYGDCYKFVPPYFYTKGE